MGAKKISAEIGLAAVKAVAAGDQGQLPTAVRYLLQALAERVPGNSVELRVPPFGATQCVAGPSHSRGTPPNLVEMDAETFFALATGSLDWPSLFARPGVTISGIRASEVAFALPLMRLN